MDKRKYVTVLGLVLIPIGAIVLTACGNEQQMWSEDQEALVLDESSQNMIAPFNRPTEWGSCRDTRDNDGNGLVDSLDPACHVNQGPIRDLSLFPAPIGHMFAPVPLALSSNLGYPAEFRDPLMIANWLEFLTNIEGEIDTAPIFGIGKDPARVPLRPPHPKVLNGTWHQGNNNTYVPFPDIYPFIGANPRFLYRTAGPNP